MAPARLYKLRELSDITGLSVEVLREAIKEDSLEAIQLRRDGAFFVAAHAYDEWIAARTLEPRRETIPAMAKTRLLPRRRDLAAFRP